MVPVQPPPLSPPLCTLPPRPAPPRFVCYCDGEGIGARGQGIFNLYVTDAVELWSTCFTPDSLAALEDGASLSLSGGPSALGFDLSKVPGPEAASRLQALTLGLAERVCSLEQRLAAAEERAVSSRKSTRQVGPQQFLPGAPHLVSPRPRSPERRPWAWGQKAVSWRVPHQPWLQEKPASGVDFDDL
ncbi:protein PAXX isoform X5 [Pteropus medius]|uniref:protein PAXX isoform X5 n=1 Tax=Pteropus vampyrus TaxID=132908 RepID=UPI00196B72F2|nr:protein PAXX isoform X5 [Pteropus giganteus]